ncbi:hypothetical protein Back2_16070 [Nocardioides baekrokdamisoli]|uniref:DAGKc domain-containing protein n=1 Tax=Nocardioides baekrokdamisoli TaxID=1804624 RepID=A0A3G9IEB3_9ACTN|nr:diacylglycerol kinase family protein [Nocardioides baekrokdamisoli]BBH17320.1 hypothetical protein Back2_16070 [Nocardioides baekrokdamisoli]
MLRRTRLLVLEGAGIAYALMVLLGVGVRHGWLSGIDRWHPAVRLSDTWRLVEVLGGTVGALVAAAAVAALLFRRHRRASLYVLGVVIVAEILHRIVASSFDRARPPWQFAEHHLSSPGYPSGHVTGAMAVVGATLVTVKMLTRRPAFRRLWYLVGAVIVVLIAYDRLALGRHYVTDVVGGLLLGGGTVLLGLMLYSPLPKPEWQPEMDSAPRGRRLAVVLNPIKVESVRQFRHTVRQVARETGWDEPDWYFTTVEDSGTGMAAAAAVAGADLVVVCGGDGTVREVCAELASTGIPVGIIPAGTGNLLARNLQIPLYLRAAIGVALTGQDRAIDLVEVSGDGFEDSAFLVMAGMGFDAAIMSGVDEGLKARIGWMAYILSGLKALMFPAMKLEVSVDEGPWTKHRARTVVIGNVGQLQGGMPLIPDAEIDDGLIDVVLLHPQRFLSWLPLSYRIITKRPHVDETVMRLRGRTVHVRASADNPRQLDGDPIADGRELLARCAQGRLLVRVPR